MKRPMLPIDLVGAASTLAVLTLVVVLGVMPIIRLKSEQAERGVRLARFESQTDAVEAEIASLRARIARTSAEIESRKLTLLPPEQLNIRIAGIIESANRMGLEVLSIEPGELETGAYYNKIPIELGLTSPLPQFVRYLHTMRAESADLVVQQIEIEARGDGVEAHLRADWLTRAD